ncbi:MAG TPA: hypothetical protein VLS88_20555 [Polyangiales bacterium]|nr:hypothetical protein [Polyangiales bacterium]
MDLTRLYNLTTPELRDEAERLGVSDTYAMSRGQLIQAIRNQQSGSQPEGVLGKVLGFAKWALQTAAAATPRSEEEQDTRVRRSSEVVVPRVGSEPEAAAGPSSGSPRAMGAESAPSAKPDSSSAAATATVVEDNMEPETAPLSSWEPTPHPGPESEEGGLTASSSRPPAGVFSRSAGTFEEPFPTRTMARILAEQGHFKRSLAIYGKLLRDQPEDAELSAEAEEVRMRSRARRSELH